MRLVTIATFDQPISAHLAKNVLTEAGIESVITDAETVAMDFLLSNAIGGIKLQVRDEDADRAVDVLDAKLGKGDSAEFDEEELERMAVEADREDDDDETLLPDLVAKEQADAPPPPPPEPESERDQYAVRCFRATIFSLVFCPLYFYAIYLFLNGAFSPGPLSPWAQRLLTAAGVILFAVMAWWWFVISSL